MRVGVTSFGKDRGRVATRLLPLRKRALGCAAALFLAIAVSACDNLDPMATRGRTETYEPNPFFANNMSARPIPEGTVPRGTLEDDGFEVSEVDGRPADRAPVEVTMGLLRRGQERYNINCAVCHGYAGYGNGMIVQRGYTQPPSLHIDRLREAPPGHYYDVITNGYGRMPAYQMQVTPHDRWAIAAYIRALQLSQNAGVEDLAPDERAALERGRP